MHPDGLRLLATLPDVTHSSGLVTAAQFLTLAFLFQNPVRHCHRKLAMLNGSLTVQFETWVGIQLNSWIVVCWIVLEMVLRVVFDNNG